MTLRGSYSRGWQLRVFPDGCSEEEEEELMKEVDGSSGSP